ncbi:hypothetical protein LINPERHAP2_LOCUS24789 [Linum perenne]
MLFSDQLGSTFRSRNCSLTISSSFDFASRHGRLAVEREGKSHFIFMDEDQMRWLVDVLTVAARANWKIPGECWRSSSRRMITVVSFWKNGVRFLCLREKCRDGKVFFINIPMDWNSTGWNLLLLKVSDFVQKMWKGSPRTSASAGVSVQRLSFAQAVATPKLATDGESRLMIGNEGAEVVVGDQGVSQRLQWLESCLVFRLERLSAAVPDWVRFREWCSNRWGIPKGTDIRPMGDDLWIMVLASPMEVKRIMRLDRWNFPDHKLSADKWVGGAGTSEVMTERGWSWFRVVGIPLHLRSEAVFDSIARAFGESAVADVCGCNLNEVRVKALNPGSVPDVVSLRFGEDRFLLHVWKGVRGSSGSPNVEVLQTAAEARCQISLLTGEPVAGRAPVPVVAEAEDIGIFRKETSFPEGNKVSENVQSGEVVKENESACFSMSDFGNCAPRTSASNLMEKVDRRACADLMKVFWKGANALPQFNKEVGRKDVVGLEEAAGVTPIEASDSPSGPVFTSSDVALGRANVERIGLGFLERSGTDNGLVNSSLLAEGELKRRTLLLHSVNEEVEEVSTVVTEKDPEREQLDALVSQCQVVSEVLQLELNSSTMEARERVTDLVVDIFEKQLRGSPTRCVLEDSDEWGTFLTRYAVLLYFLGRAVLIV